MSANASKPAVCLTAPAAPISRPATSARSTSGRRDSAATKANVVSAATGNRRRWPSTARTAADRRAPRQSRPPARRSAGPTSAARPPSPRRRRPPARAARRASARAPPRDGEQREEARRLDVVDGQVWRQAARPQPRDFDVEGVVEPVHAPQRQAHERSPGERGEDDADRSERRRNGKTTRRPQGRLGRRRRAIGGRVIAGRG